MPRMQRAAPDPAAAAERAQRLREAAVAMQAKLAEERARGPKRRDAEPSRRPWSLAALLLVALLAVLCCLGPCGEAEVPTPADREGPAVPQATGPPPAAEPPPLAGRVPSVPRPTFPRLASESPPWLASLRMQVAARSPQLAACFEGVQRPGVLRWTAWVDPATGRVSEQELMPVLSSDGLSAQQQQCVGRVLQDPAYGLEGGEAARVGMVLEF